MSVICVHRVVRRCLDRTWSWAASRDVVVGAAELTRTIESRSGPSGMCPSTRAGQLAPPGVPPVDVAAGTPHEVVEGTLLPIGLAAQGLRFFCQRASTQPPPSIATRSTATPVEDTGQANDFVR